MKNNLRKRDDRCMYGNNLVRFMRNDLNTLLEYCDGYTVHSPSIYITRTTAYIRERPV